IFRATAPFTYLKHFILNPCNIYAAPYTILMKLENTPTRTKLFNNGGSTAVRLPKAIIPESSEVEIQSCGNTIIIKPVNDFSSLRDAASSLRDSIDEFAPKRDIAERVEQI
ncbi:MAG: hypothetical protein CUN55_19095, partial [Phototrophicales bacterium]